MAATGSARRAWLALLRAPGVGPVRVLRLLELTGSPQAALGADSRQWRAAGIAERLHRGLRAPDWKVVDQDEAWLEDPRHRFVAFDDPLYPKRLRAIPDPPMGLFAVGDAGLLDAPQLAVVGARLASPQGRRDATRFATELVAAGFTVTSGLAVGIDAAAHAGALDGDGTTIAVCAHGLDRVYPARHRELAQRISRSGLLVSEFPPGIAPRREYFPRRNRLISGLALGVLVVEARKRSGSLITARLAAEQGREVFAVPGSIHNPLASGCHALIRDGARLVESVADIFEELGLPATGPSFPAAPAPAVDDPLQRRVLDELGFAPMALDALIERLQVDIGPLHEALLSLELAGRIAAGPGEVFTQLADGIVARQ